MKLSESLAFLLSGIAALAPIPIGAVRAVPEPVPYTQPDGSEIQILIEGDERGHELYSTDGCLLLQDASGFLVYAIVGENGLPAPSSSRISSFAKKSGAESHFLSKLNRQAISKAIELQRSERELARTLGDAPKYIFSGTPFPSAGSPKALVILVDYPDRSFSMDSPQEYFDRQLNLEGYSDFDNMGSVRDYFIKSSNGRFSPEFDVYGPITMSNPLSYYGQNTGIDDTHPDEMVIEACTALSKITDLSDYDNNGDGYIDNIFIIYAGFGEADSGIDDTIWPHSAELETDFNQFVEIGGLKLNRYGCTCEMTRKYGNRVDGIGTFVHEFSHGLGLPDLYSTLLPSGNTPKYWSVMDSGNYNNEGRTPPIYSSFEKYSLNWIEPDPLPLSGDYSLPDLSETNHAYILPTERPDEFFLLENRQQHGFDKYLPYHGMLCWHIDFDQGYWDRNVVNNNSRHPRVDLVEADGIMGAATLEGDSFPGTSNTTELGASTYPYMLAWSGESIGVELSQIAEADNTITFHAEVSNSGVTSPYDKDISWTLENGMLISQTPVSVYDLTGRMIATAAPGKPLRLQSGLYIIGSSKVLVK